ncbi:MAG: DUF3617 domain-containing protein [Novosphingobium sp.]|nr:DUF3617 domain-containing protein [Novosphingobium sp.]
MSKEFRFLMLAACAAGSIMLTGCGGDGAREDGAQTNEAAAPGGGPKAGQWESTITLGKVEVAEEDSELKEFFQSAVGQTKTSTSCLTPEEAGKPNADFFQGEDSGCTYDKFSMSGGKVDSELSCEDGGSKMKVTMTGTYSEDSYEIASTAEGDIMPETPGSMSMTATGKRLGDCPAEEAKPAEG